MNAWIAFIHMLRESGSDNNNTKVLLPGELRWETYEKNVKQGLVINSETTAALTKLADHYQVDMSQLDARSINTVLQHARIN